ncbi:hypothetical protein SAMN05421785_101662 [Chryseobacterium gambrini]|uniref:Uncharacterized protein n=1 Tax=Chryseobacterium gambrini TaxID=373672 RepID=A0A1N7KQF5_9FLAO|nr:hypothetical protein SAMN05421785_101662 [Chryseobacterium gambrini]
MKTLKIGDNKLLCIDLDLINIKTIHHYIQNE